jgi:hypothetical protein
VEEISVALMSFDTSFGAGSSKHMGIMDSIVVVNVRFVSSTSTTAAAMSLNVRINDVTEVCGCQSMRWMIACCCGGFRFVMNFANDKPISCRDLEVAKVDSICWPGLLAWN